MASGRRGAAASRPPAENRRAAVAPAGAAAAQPSSNARARPSNLRNRFRRDPPTMGGNALDMYRKVAPDLMLATNRGGFFSIVAIGFMAYLGLMETWAFLGTGPVSERIDVELGLSPLRINVDLEFPRLRCEDATVLPPARKADVREVAADGGGRAAGRAADARRDARRTRGGRVVAASRLRRGAAAAVEPPRPWGRRGGPTASRDVAAVRRLAGSRRTRRGGIAAAPRRRGASAVSRRRRGAVGPPRAAASMRPRGRGAPREGRASTPRDSQVELYRGKTRSTIRGLEQTLRVQRFDDKTKRRSP